MDTKSPDLSDRKFIMSIDIGIHHLALMLLEMNPDFTFQDIVWFELVDITQFHHLDEEAKKNCPLKHSKTVSDWLSHITYLNQEAFMLAEHVLIERQPFQGHTAVEQLLFYQFRDKAVLISPRSVHKFFGWGPQIDYEQRKERSIRVMQYKLKSTTRPWLQTEFDALSRQHDVSDALTQALFFLYNRHKDYKTTTPIVSIIDFDKYRFQVFIT